MIYNKKLKIIILTALLLVLFLLSLRYYFSVIQDKKDIILLTVPKNAILSDYMIYLRKIRYKNQNIMITRKLKINGVNYFLGVKIDDKYQTVLIKSSSVSFFNNILYSFADYKKFNKNIEKNNSKDNIYITIDLCPSSKEGFDRELFLEIIEYAKKRHINPNISVAISYYFYKEHKNEFKEIMDWIKNKELNVVFINHSYHHFYDKNIKNDNQNFMIHNIENAESDILKNELFLLNAGILPSVFFRFPGLIYNEKLMNILQNLKLFPVGSSLWLAKDGKKNPEPGDIILIHGNKNEPLGVKKFINLIKSNRLDGFKFGNIHEIIE